MNSSTAETTVLVAGDVTMDWNLAGIGPDGADLSTWTADVRSRICRQEGGAALLGGVVCATLDDRPDVAIHVPDVRSEPVPCDDARFHHAYAMWRRDGDGAWRVHQFLGLDPRGARECAAVRVTNVREADVVVVDDAALGFRTAEKHWPSAVLDDGTRPWILLKTASPVASGPLWDRLIRHHADRLVVVLAVEDLRRTEVQVSRGLSWERTAQDVAWELLHNPGVNGLSHCAHTVVSFGTAGAILHSGSGSALRLIFDPTVMEGEWETAGRGGMIGNTATLTAAIVRRLVESPDEPDLAAGIRSGIHAMRALYTTGYRRDSGPGDDLDIGFPLQAVADAIRSDPDPLATVDVQDPVRFVARGEPAGKAAPARTGFWTVLEDRYRDGLTELAERIVLDGLDCSLSDVPIGRIGLLTTVDRHEIESLRSVQSLMREYSRHRLKKPLSIAVFGPPGSGKSFGVEQVADSVQPGAIEKLTFNLSQFDDPGDLLGALHQVRDVGLSGKLPLVFWDEFDTSLDRQPLGWLRHFLAPMQDGSFQEGQITHPIGGCLFVFAGGTCASMDEFESSLASDEQRKAAKLPDFASRLKGFLNVLGPDPRTGPDGRGDPYHVVRRAILLRSLLERNAPHLVDRANGRKHVRIDNGVLRAFLRVGRYKHGIRSMESILAMSELSGRRSFQRSSLPSETQLDLHVNGREFLSRVQSLVLTGKLVERLAESAHEVWREGKERDGWAVGEPKCEEARTHPWLVPYEELPEHAKDANRVTVRAIPQKLALAGYAMMPARSNETALEFPGDDLERLAEFEHELWMEAKLQAGFHAGTPTEEDPLRNEYLVPWNEVPEEIKQADRDLVRGIQQILAKAGYAVVRLER